MRPVDLSSVVPHPREDQRAESFESAARRLRFRPGCSPRACAP